MTKERKASSTRDLAITHYLTSGFAIPVIAAALFGYLLASPLSAYPIAYEAVMLAVHLGSLWFGVMYSANFLKKTYLIREPMRVASLASKGYLIVGAILLVLSFLLSGYGEERAIAYLALDVASFGIGWYVFSTASKKYVGSLPASA